MNDLSWTILQALPEPIIFVDVEHAIQFMNPAATELFEVPDIDDVIGTAFKLLPSGTGLMTHEERIEAVKRHNEFATHPTLTPKPDDEQIWSGIYENRHFHFQAIPIYDRNKNLGYVIRVDDITKERSASEYLQGLPSDMISPITAIKGFAEILSTEELSIDLTEEKRLKFANHIKERAHSLLKLRDSIIDFNRKYLK